MLESLEEAMGSDWIAYGDSAGFPIPVSVNSFIVFRSSSNPLVTLNCIYFSGEPSTMDILRTIELPVEMLYSY
ncbi:hypothetical protein DOT_1961 [Desulfosporosinus sp. OT]|nr:hypothetical protein DOT_1961 [Desulfosporosinus sp. OT]